MVTRTKRLLNKLTRWYVDFGEGYSAKPSRVLPLGRYNLVASQQEGGQHIVAIDIDKEAALYPSSTDGHYHLLIDSPMSWDSYRALLYALAAAGIIEEGYAQASVSHGMSYLRPPGVHKGTDDTLINVVEGLRESA